MLLHPIPVELRRASAALTVFDQVAREPVRHVWKAGQGPGLGAVLELEAQVNWNDGVIRRPRFLAGGVEEESAGYLLFRVEDLLAASVANAKSDGTLALGIARGDQITRIGLRQVKLFVVWFRDIASYPDQGGATLLEVHFGDRAPSVPDAL